MKRIRKGIRETAGGGVGRGGEGGKEDIQMQGNKSRVDRVGGSKMGGRRRKKEGGEETGRMRKGRGDGSAAKNLGLLIVS